MTTRGEALTRALSLARKFADFDYQQRATHYLWLFSVRASALDDALAMARQFEEVAGFGDAQSRAVVDFWSVSRRSIAARTSKRSTRLQRAIEHYPDE